MRVQGSGSVVHGSGFKVQDSGYRVQGSGFGVWDYFLGGSRVANGPGLSHFRRFRWLEPFSRTLRRALVTGRPALGTVRLLWGWRFWFI